MASLDGSSSIHRHVRAGGRWTLLALAFWIAPSVSSADTIAAGANWYETVGGAMHCLGGCRITSGPGCDTSIGQCSFPKATARALCGAHPQCRALICNSTRGDCQARDAAEAANVVAGAGYTSHIPYPPPPPAPSTAAWTESAGSAIHCLGGCRITSGPGCDTSIGQCSFPKDSARALCAAHPQCAGVICNSLRGDCQARDAEESATVIAGSGYTIHVRVGAPTPPAPPAPTKTSTWREYAGQAFILPGATGIRIKSGPGCLSTVGGQCTFPKDRARELCNAHPQCRGLVCNSQRADCQARDAGEVQALQPWPGMTSLLMDVDTDEPVPTNSFEQLDSFQRDPNASFVPARLATPELRTQMASAISKATGADDKLSTAMANIAKGAMDGTVFGVWKTKTVCANVQLDVPGYCEAYFYECTAWGWPQCTANLECTSPCTSWKRTDTCVLWIPTAVRLEEQCKDIQYLDITEGALFVEARTAAEGEVKTAQGQLKTLQDKVVAESRKTIGDIATTVTSAATQAYSAVETSARDLWTKADAETRRIVEEVFKFSAASAVKLLDPIFGNAPVEARLERELDRRLAHAAPLDGYLSERRRAASKAQCQVKPPFLDDCKKWDLKKGQACPAEYVRGVTDCGCTLNVRPPWDQSPQRQLRTYIGLGIKGFKELMQKVLHIRGTWAKLLDIAEVQRWRYVDIVGDRTPGLIDDAIEWFAKLGAIEALIKRWNEFYDVAGGFILNKKDQLMRVMQAAREGLAKIADGAVRAVKITADRLSQLADEVIDAFKAGGESLKAFLEKIAKFCDEKLLKPLAAKLRAAIAAIPSSGPESTALKTLKLLEGHLLPNIPTKAARDVGSALVKMGTKVLAAAAPVLARIAPAARAAAAGIAQGAKTAAKTAASAVTRFAKRFGLPLVATALQWAAIGVAYPWADGECSKAAGIETNCAWSQAEGKSCPDGYLRTAVCTCQRRNTTQADYRACYVGKFKEWSKQSFFDALVGTAIDALDVPVLTPLAVGITTAVATAVGLAFTPATAATTGAVMGFASKVAASILLTIYADQLFPYYEREIYGPMEQYWTDRANDGADTYWNRARDPARLVDESKNSGGSNRCTEEANCNFNRECKPNGLCGDK